MHDDVRRSALVATAKVAWAGLLLGCGTQSPAPASAPPVEPSPVRGAEPPPPRAAAEPTTPSALAACEVSVDEALAATSSEDATEAQKACCRDLQASHEAADANMRWRGPRRSFCCSALGWASGGACTPWGPPMPPSLAARPRGAGGVLDLGRPSRTARLDARLGPIAAGNLRSAAVATWRGRMVNEYGSARVFEGLAAQLEDAGFPPAVVAQCAAFATEERRHGVLCGAVVEALGSDASAPDVPPTPFADHPDAADDLEAVLRNVLSICCLSETVAVALIGAERLLMADGALCALLTRIYGDEVGHARFGWRLVAELLAGQPLAEREALVARLDRYLPQAFAHLEEHELHHLPLASASPPEGAALGLCSGRAARALFYDTVEQVIVPSLTALSLDAATAWRRRGTA